MTMSLASFRRRWISIPLFNYVKKSLPPISDTERQALEAGDVWWDAELLSGKPDWSKLTSLQAPGFTEAEQAFLDGPVAQLCDMIDDWKLSFEQRRLPDEIWEFIKQQGFLGMIIPEQYGGLGFSATAHSEVVMQLSTRSTSLAVTVMVPNSLGPGELLMHFGTEEQKDYYLPRLASGQEIPCFGLTSPEAGSDAGAMIDTGVVCQGDFQGESVLGIRLNWHKRYITLGPVATLLGLAFKLSDPDGLLGEQQDLGITVALIPTDLPGIDIGRRHYPSMQAFQNGPNWGRDVFVPLDAIIGGPEQAGEGWKMLMSALAAGRSISLPSLSVGGAKLAVYSTGAYARIREQFGIPICKFEGIQAPLAEIAATSYVFDAARLMTTGALDRGIKPAVISAILKSNATDALRDSINHAMDIHGGKGVCDGPSNYLDSIYRAVPVAITVEGANILTRSLIIFGQGAIRCHPYLLTEMTAAQNPDQQQGLQQFEAVVFKHVGFAVSTALRSLFGSLTAGLFSGSPAGLSSDTKRFYQQLNRYSAALTFVTELSLLGLGGELKRREMLSARLGDVLSELYLLSCVLQRYRWDGEPQQDLPILRWSFAKGLQTIEQRLQEVIGNFPIRPVAWLMRLIAMPLGRWQQVPSDQLTRQVADLIVDDTASRRRLVKGMEATNPESGLGQVIAAFEGTVANAGLLEKYHASGEPSIQQALDKAILSQAEADSLNQLHAAVSEAIKVDDFAADELAPKAQRAKTAKRKVAAKKPPENTSK
jgi:acyl-CoA dehydrogenase